MEEEERREVTEDEEEEARREVTQEDDDMELMEGEGEEVEEVEGGKREPLVQVPENVFTEVVLVKEEDEEYMEDKG